MNYKNLRNLFISFIVLSQFIPVCFGASLYKKRKVTISKICFTAHIWDTETDKCIINLEGHTDWVRTVYFSPDGTKIVTASYDRTAKIWDIPQKKSFFKCKKFWGGVLAAATVGVVATIILKRR